MNDNNVIAARISILETTTSDYADLVNHQLASTLVGRRQLWPRSNVVVQKSMGFTKLTTQSTSERSGKIREIPRSSNLSTSLDSGSKNALLLSSFSKKNEIFVVQRTPPGPGSLNPDSVLATCLAQSHRSRALTVPTAASRRCTAMLRSSTVLSMLFYRVLESQGKSWRCALIISSL